VDVDGRGAIVTGAGAGIGSAVAARLAAGGAAVLVVDRDGDAAREAAARIDRAGGRAVPHVADLGDSAAAAGLADVGWERLGRVDVLVNNAGGVGDRTFPANDLRQWRAVIELNLVGVMAAIQGALPYMTDAGGGAVVNISSVAALGSRPHGAPEYAAAKAGVVRLTTALGSLATTAGVRVNCICPDWVDTPTSRRTREGMDERERATVPPVLLTPEQIADAVAFFVASDELAGRVMAWWCGEESHLLEPERRE